MVQQRGLLPSHGACRAACDAEPACVGYSYSDTPKICYVFGPGI
eukprot:COSAG05_NODE_18402_length_309_cov_0.642857_1_plen_43_part_10